MPTPGQAVGNSSRGSGAQVGGAHPIPPKRQNVRIYDRWILKLFAVLVVTACAVILGQSAPRQRIGPGLATLGGGFVSGTAKANGTPPHYVRGGTGPAIILLHGFPEDWYEYHRVMPLLAKQFRVVAVDLRGIGGSAATAGGYDAANVAEDVHQLGADLVANRVVQDRNRITSGGITAGIDFGLRVAAELRGEDCARFLTPALEYDPQPPYGSGTPENATPAVEKTSHSVFDPVHVAFRDAALEARKKWVS